MTRYRYVTVHRRVDADEDGMLLKFGKGDPEWTAISLDEDEQVYYSVNYERVAVHDFGELLTADEVKARLESEPPEMLLDRLGLEELQFNADDDD